MATTQVTLPTGTYTLDPVHSSVGFAVKHMVVATFRGSFADYDASLTVREDGLPSLSGSVEVKSIQVKDPNLTAHLLTPEFFDAERHPQITFETRDAKLSDEGQLVIDGELTINGVARPIEARGELSYVAADMGGGERIGVTLETIVDRTVFGLNWNAPLPKGGVAVENDVKLHVDLEFVRTRES